MKLYSNYNLNQKMENPVKRIKEIYEKGKSPSNVNESNENPQKTRRVSNYIKNRVQFYDKKCEENDKNRKSRSLLEISKKFGLHKFFKLAHNSTDNSENKEITTSVTSYFNLESNEDSEVISSTENVSQSSLQNFFLEVQEEWENYEKEIENLKKKNSEKTGDNNNTITNNSCCVCEKLTQELENKNILIKEKEQELNKLKKENEELHQKYEDFNLHIGSMMNYITNDEILLRDEFENTNDNEINLLEVQKENFPYINSLKNKTSTNNNLDNKYPDTYLIEVIGESIFKDYKLKLSLNISSINEKILSSGNKAFLNYLTTSFMNDNMGSLSLSIYHEYLQDIITEIYIAFRKYRAGKVTNMIEDDYSWIISEEDINEEIILLVTEDIFSYYSNLKTKTSFKDTAKLFEETFTKHYTKYFLHLHKEIKENYFNKIKKYIQKVKTDIGKIVKLCSSYIHAGKLFYRTNLIFDYWKLYNDILSFEQGNNFYSSEIIKNTATIINYYQTSEAPEFSGYLHNKLKFKGTEYETISLTGNINDDEEVINFPQLKIIASYIITNQILSNKLKSLTITEMNLTSEESLSFLNKLIEFCANLSTLDVSSNKLGDKGIRLLTESLKSNTSIKTLHLSYNDITSNGSFYLAEMLLRNKTISNLFLGGNCLVDLGLQSLVNILIKDNRSIKLLDLSNNNLKGSDLIIIANLIIKNCENLKTLNLSNHKFDLDAVNSLGIALKNNTKLKSIYLNNIGLDEESVPYFMQHLIEANVEEVYLDENNLGEVGGVLFANVIKYNQKIRRVSLKRTGVNSISLMCIGHALESEVKRSCLECLKLDENFFDLDSIGNIVNTMRMYHNERQNCGNLLRIHLSADCIDERSLQKIIELDIENFIVL